MAGSGHIAGVVNPPARKKYQYWTGPDAEGRLRAMDCQGGHRASRLLVAALADWIEAKDNTRVPARKPGKHMKTLGDAPGTYVKVRV